MRTSFRKRHFDFRKRFALVVYTIQPLSIILARSLDYLRVALVLQIREYFLWQCRPYSKKKKKKEKRKKKKKQTNKNKTKKNQIPARKYKKK